MNNLVKLINAAGAADRVFNALPRHFENRTLELQFDVMKRQPIRNKGKSTLAVAALIATGCRPAELAQGLKITLDIDNTLVVTIPMRLSKDASMSNLNYRLIRIKDRSRNLATETLFDVLTKKQGMLHIQMSASRIAKLIQSLNDKLKEDMGKKGRNIQITPKVFRQLFIRQLLYPNFFSESEVLGICGLYDPRSLRDYVCDIPHTSPNLKWVDFIEYKTTTSQGGAR